MELSLFSLPQLFDEFSDAVLFFSTDQQDGAPSYANPKAILLLQDDEVSSLLPRLLEQESSTVRLALSCGETLVTVSSLPTGRLFYLRTLPPLQDLPSLDIAASQMRDHLSHLFASWEHILQRLRQTNKLASYEDHLCLYVKKLHQILRLVQQMELLPQEALLEYPVEPLNVSALCQELSYDLAGRTHPLPFTFTWDIDQGLLVSGRRVLLEHLVLSLLSNAIKAAGPLGQVRLTLKKVDRLSESRAELTIRDNGPGISQDRLHRLFCPQTYDKLPRPEDGSGLDLYLAHRIATLHKGVLMAGSSPDDGTQITFSFPLAPPPSLVLRSPNFRLPDEGFSRLLTGLSDVLPAALFSPCLED